MRVGKLVTSGFAFVRMKCYVVAFFWHGPDNTHNSLYDASSSSAIYLASVYEGVYVGDITSSHLMHSLNELVGKKIIRVFMNEEYLRFDTNNGSFTFTVHGDCCSHSVFYDFVGIKKLLHGGPVVATKEIELHPDDIEDLKDDDWYPLKDRKKKAEDIKVYGYSITTEHPEFGEVTSVFSFRNYSNGYYGGWMEDAVNIEVHPEILDDVIETVPHTPQS